MVPFFLRNTVYTRHTSSLSPSQNTELPVLSVYWRPFWNAGSVFKMLLSKGKIKLPIHCHGIRALSNPASRTLIFNWHTRAKHL